MIPHGSGRSSVLWGGSLRRPSGQSHVGPAGCWGAVLCGGAGTLWGLPGCWHGVGLRITPGVRSACAGQKYPCAHPGICLQPWAAALCAALGGERSGFFCRMSSHPQALPMDRAGSAQGPWVPSPVLLTSASFPQPGPRLHETSPWPSRPALRSGSRREVLLVVARTPHCPPAPITPMAVLLGPELPQR